MSNTKNSKIRSSVPLAVERSADSASSFAAAYERRLPEMMALREKELATLNVDSAKVVTTVLGTLPWINAFGGRLSALLGRDEALVEDLEDYARAAAEAHSRFLTAGTSEPAVTTLNKEAIKMRNTLQTDVRALVLRGLIDGARLASFKGHVGYKNVAFDLIDYANLLEDCWGQVEGRTAIQREEILKARLLAEELVRAAGRREQGTCVIAEAAQMRRRAMTLLLRAYDETRRAIGFLRWHEGDVEKIAPSLYKGRGGRGKGHAPSAASGFTRTRANVLGSARSAAERAQTPSPIG